MRARALFRRARELVRGDVLHERHLARGRFEARGELVVRSERRERARRRGRERARAPATARASSAAGENPGVSSNNDSHGESSAATAVAAAGDGSVIASDDAVGAMRKSCSACQAAATVDMGGKPQVRSSRFIETAGHMQQQIQDLTDGRRNETRTAAFCRVFYSAKRYSSAR